jgi:hypothetical protein
MWSILLPRNRWAHGVKGYHSKEAVESAYSTLLELGFPQVQSNLNQRPECTWRCPADNIIKLNIDEALNKLLSVAGTGGVATGSVGVFIGAWCKGYPGIDDPLISEALAMLFFSPRLKTSVEYPLNPTVQNWCGCGKLGR